MNTQSTKINYSLIILLLSRMDQWLIKDPSRIYHWLCSCLYCAYMENKVHNAAPEVLWIKRRIRQATVGHLSVQSALQALRPGIKVTPEEAYELRKYLIQRWIGEARLCMSESTSS